MLEKDIQSIGRLTHQKIAAATDALRLEIAEQGDQVEKQCLDIIGRLEKETSELDRVFSERLKHELEQQKAIHKVEIDSIRERLIEQASLDELGSAFHERLDAEVEKQQATHKIEIESIRERLIEQDSLDELGSELDERLNAELQKQQSIHKIEIESIRERLIEQDSLDDLGAIFEERLNAEVEKQQSIHRQEVESITQRLAEEKALVIESIEAINEQLEQRIDLEQKLVERIETIKDGEQGEQGERGTDGLDRPVLEPVHLKANKDYPKNTLGLYKGGLWISTKDALGYPQDDPHAWHCILDAMNTLSVDLQEDRTFKLSVETSAGNVIENNFHIPFPQHKGIWEEGEYSKGDIVTKGHSMFHCIEDTSGRPPGNGWQQILTAQRGRDGKSIVGPQGVPGRNGLDAKLPENFIEEVLELASQNKAFEDGRSGAEVITSFRGYFLSGETYNRGDVVNLDAGLYVCTSSGQFDSIAKSQDSWELMLNVPKLMMPAFMDWQGRYVAKTYKSGMVVADGPWTMVANKETNDSAGPYPIGDESYLAAGATYAPLADTVKNVVFGTRIKQVQSPVFIRGYKIDVIDTFSYRVFFVQDPLNSPIVVELDSFTATATETLEVNLGRLPVGAGDSFDIVAVINEPDPTPTEWTGDWDYDTPPVAVIPPAGVILQANDNPASLRVSILDNTATDRSAELSPLSNGDTISDGASVWTITNSVDNGTWFDFTVSPNQQSPTDGLRTFTFGTTTPTAITIGSDADYWVGNANIRGIHTVDGGYSDIVEDDNAYSIDLQVQDAYVSPDWEVVSYSSELGAQPEAVPVSELTKEENDWVRASAYLFDEGATQTTDNSWTEVDRREVTEASKGKISLDAKRIDQTEYHNSEWAFIAYNDGTQLVSYLQKDIELGADLSLRLVEDGNDLVIEVRGKAGQTWQWSATAFYRGIE